MLKVLLVLAVVVLAGLFYVRGAAPVPEGTSQFAPPPTAAAGEVSVELTQAALSSRLSEQMVGQPLGNTPLGQATLTSLSAELKPNQLLATGDAQVAGKSVPVSMTGHVDMQGSRPLAVVSDVRAAGVPMPEGTRESIRKVLQNQVDQEIERLKMKVKSITIVDGKILIIGTR